MTDGQVGRWVSLAAGIWVQSLAGNSNTFPNYAPSLKQLLGLNQVQLNNLGVAKDFGENVGLLAGTLCNVVPAWALLLIGALEGFVGYGTLWLVMSGYIAPLPYWQLCILLMIGANCTTCFNTCNLLTSMKNFPKSRGTVVGIIKGFLGLSSAIFTQIYVAALMSNSTNLVLLLAVGPLAVILVAMFFIRPFPDVDDGRSGVPDSDEQNGFVFIHVVCIGLALYLVVASFVESMVANVSPLAYKILMAGMLVFLVSPLAIPAKLSYTKYLIGREKAVLKGKLSYAPVISTVEEPLLQPAALRCESEESTSKTETKDEASNAKIPNEQSTEPQLAYETRKLGSARDLIEEGAGLEGGVMRRRRGPRRGEDFTLIEALVKADFWLLFFTYFCAMGTGITAMNNLGQMGEAQGYSDVTIFVSLASIMNFLGRLGGGTLSEHYMRTTSLPRTVSMLVAQLALIVVMLLFASALPGSLHVGSIVLGFCYGMHVAIIVPTASELFGLRNFGMIYNFITIVNPIGSLLFSGILAGYLYDREAQKGMYGTGLGHPLSSYLSPPRPGEMGDCTGAHCFRLTFIIMAGVCFVGLILNVILTLRIRPVYRAMFEARFGSRDPSYQSLHNEEQSISSSRSSSRAAIHESR